MIDPAYGKVAGNGNPLHGNTRMWFGWFATDDGVVPLFKYDVLSAMDMARHVRIVDMGPEEKKALLQSLNEYDANNPAGPRAQLVDIAALLWPRPQR